LSRRYQEMECTVEEHNGITRVILAGELDTEEAAKTFRNVMHDLLMTGKKRPIIDMSRLESINSHGIGKLLLFYKKFKDAGGEIQISSPQGHVKDVFETLMLNRLFKIN